MKVVRENDLGEAIPWPEILTPDQGAVVILMEKVGMPLVDSYSIDEFVRRADLYTTYIASCLLEGGKEVPVTREIILSVMDGCRLMWSDSPAMSDAEFARMIMVAKTNRLTNQQ